MFRLRRFFKGYVRDSILSPLFKMLEASLELFVPIVVKRIIDVGIAGNDTSYIVKMCLLLVLLSFAGLVFSVTAQFFAARSAVGFSSGLRSELFAHINSLGYPEIDTLGSSALITRLTNDVNQVQNGVNLFLRLLLRSPFVVAGAVIMAFTVDARSALIFTGAVPLLGIAVFAIMFGAMPLYKNVQRRLDGLLGAARENLNGVRVIRAFGKEKEETESFRSSANTLARANLKAGRISALMNPVTYVILNISIVILIYTGAIRVNSGAMTQGSVVALYNYMSQILVELIKLANLLITVSRAAASAGRINSVFELKSSVWYPEKGAQPDTAAPAVEFRNVSLRYGDDSDDSLSGVSFTAKKGETLGIIGSTGSGKSSIVNLIPRFYDASEGEVIVFGHNVKEYDRKTLSSLVSVAPQNAVLFTGTVRDNIKMGSEDATDEEIIIALENAGFGELAAEGKNGLDRNVEQGGRNFSGGQCQRIGIARALVKKAPVLILDDSFSALDFATERHIRSAISELSEKPLVITVSQRAASVMRCDTILVTEDGSVTGAGTHDELIRTNPVYREIFESLQQ